MILLNILFENTIIGINDLEDYMLNNFFCKNALNFSILCDLNSIVHFPPYLS